MQLNAANGSDLVYLHMVARDLCPNAVPIGEPVAIQGFVRNGAAKYERCGEY
jgi:hypothetical protein